LVVRYSLPRSSPWHTVKALERQYMEAQLKRAGTPRSEASMGEFYAWLGKKKSAHLRLTVMDMSPFRLATAAHAPQAAILFDKFHAMRHLGEALDQVRKSEYGRLAGAQLV
jgi:transposase